MNLSPLQLKKYFLTELVVKAIPPNPAASLPAASGGMRLTTKVHHAQNKANIRDWRVGLHISCQPDGRGNCPYLIEMELLGFFEVSPAIKEEHIKTLVMANAPALLYGAAREMVLQITGRGPNGPFMLPAATFIDEVSTQNQNAAHAASVE